MNISKKLILSMLCFCFTALGMDSAKVQTQTIDDLRHIVNHLGMELPEHCTTVSEIISRMKDHRRRMESEITCERTIDALELGAELLETAVALETLAKEKGYVLWWRYTPRGVDKDIEEKFVRSFGRTLLDGFAYDGIEHFRDGQLGFQTACTYIYWANAHYFRYHFFEGPLQFVKDFKKYISENGYCFDTSSLTALENYANKNQEQQKGGEADINYDELNPLFLKAGDEVRDIILQIQLAPKYNRDVQGKDIQNLYNRKNNELMMDGKRMTEALSGYLIALPLTVVEEEKFLRQEHNRGVPLLRSFALLGQGEHFHPRLLPQQLEEFKGRFVTIYSKGQFSSEEQLIEQLRNKIKENA